MLERLIAASFCLVCLVGCPDKEADPATDSGANSDVAVHDADNIDSDASDPADTSAATCYEGWSGDAACCLLGTAQPSGPGGCPGGLFAESECGRLDPICEGVDLGGPPQDMGGDIVATLLAATNAARSVQQDCGTDGMLGPVGALTLNAQLTAAAQTHADDMAATNSVSFMGSDGSMTNDRTTAAGYPSTMVLENIGSGFPDAEAAIDAWLLSDGTCANVMNDQMTEFGAGYAMSAATTVYWSQVLGAP